MIAGKHILLIVSGGIAAYKALELIRLIQKAGGTVQAILTESATRFVTPLSVSTLCGRPALVELFDLTRETEIGHIELSRSADLIVVAPATAHLLARMAGGLADDLASTCLLATDTPVLVAPAMNVRMWQHPATRRNLEILAADGVTMVGPDEGEMACGEYGPGRLAQPQAILTAIEAHFARMEAPRPLAGRHVIVTSGPTREPIDPVRYISNQSSGRQGAAIAEALAELGARVSFVTGPAEVTDPRGCDIVPVETALEMEKAVNGALPADAAIFCAAVADWRVASPAGNKIKKDGSGTPPVLEFIQNPDILASIARLEPARRPALVVGFAAETENLVANAEAKRRAKGCDWLLANDVSPGTGVMGGSDTAIVFFDAHGSEDWGQASKRVVARRLAGRVAGALAAPGSAQGV
ncbi:bifunctional phosphopantothenoylcysteine decarboxylase/phosphopantothenate--cysteine ligase CoaBC [Pelagibacterium montanilacus]|uniref:bifunctional phosphopantothenoylcysteine decarboxylase/phosphopantothenate--cysteine ligase CoaBC n=1 Tax=Pelagibacterium montanilacus TaxID=2185280 RepID=UPI000F8E56C7|nr:bifunctional phosphopantothenoylcysteine decarboxylase/phosphopantothenate--cysteine ligase CoaBC [Pelagibacterium montanilacus]